MRLISSLLISSALLCPSLAHSEALEVDLRAIAQIESSNNPKAYNKASDAVGLCQITKPCLVEWNRHHLRDTYNMGDLYNDSVNQKLAHWYLNERIPVMLNFYHIEDTVDNRLKAYNWGIGNLRKHILYGKPLPKETKDYIKRYHEALKGLK